MVGVRFTPFPEAPINNIKLHILCDNGKIIVKNAFSGKAMYAEFLDFFHCDDVVICLNGVNFVQRLPNKPDDPINCVVCGMVQEQGRRKCVACGHTLHIIEEDSDSENK